MANLALIRVSVSLKRSQKLQHFLLRRDKIAKAKGTGAREYRLSTRDDDHDGNAVSISLVKTLVPFTRMWVRHFAPRRTRFLLAGSKGERTSQRIPFTPPEVHLDLAGVRCLRAFN